MAAQENLQSEALRTATALRAPDQLRGGGSPQPAASDKKKIAKLAKLGKGKTHAR
jgi:hypothetical protein